MPKPGDLVAGKYRILDQLGQGGFGTVYRALHVDLEKEVALKVLRPEVATTDDARRRFLREIEAATRFVHKHAVQVREVGRDPTEGFLYFTMDLVQGPTLRKALAAGPFTEERALRLGVQILDVLDEAHRAGIVHRDLKPENVMLATSARGTEEARVLDFGIASAASFSQESTTALTLSGLSPGTLAYRAPEQASGGKVDGRADLYAVGVVLYECLSGKKPIEPDPDAEDARQSLLMNLVVKPPRDLGALAPHVSEPVRAAILRALAKKPADRFADARAFRDALLAPKPEPVTPAAPEPAYVKTQVETALPADTLSRLPTAPEPARADTLSHLPTAPEPARAIPARRPTVLIVLCVIIFIALALVVGWGLAPPDLRARLPWGKPRLVALDPAPGAPAELDSWEAHVHGQLSPTDAGPIWLGEAGRAPLEVPLDGEGHFDATVAVTESATALLVRAGPAPGEPLATIPLAIRRAPPRKPLALVALSPPPGTKVVLGHRSLAVSGQVTDPEGGPLEIGEDGALAPVPLDARGRFDVSVPLSPHATAVLVSGPGDTLLARIDVELDAEAIALEERKAAAAKLASGLVVDTEPEGAYVLLDDVRELGRAPVGVQDLAPGKHKLVASLDGYEEQEQSLEVAPGRQDVKLVLAPCRGTLQVETSVPATLEVTPSPGGEPVAGATEPTSPDPEGPASTRIFGLAIGTYRVRASRKGFDPADALVEIKRRRETRVALDLAEHPGAVWVRSIPTGLPATLDGVEIGETPVRKEAVAAGPHEVVVTNADGVQVEATVVVHGDETSPVTVDVATEAKKQSKERADAALEQRYEQALESGAASRRANQPDEAIRAYGVASSIFPDRAEPYFLLACAEAARGDARAAESALEKAVANGFQDTDRILGAPDLELLRADPAYVAFMGKTFGPDVAKAVQDAAARARARRQTNEGQ